MAELLAALGVAASVVGILDFVSKEVTAIQDLVKNPKINLRKCKEFADQMMLASPLLDSIRSYYSLQVRADEAIVGVLCILAQSVYDARRTIERVRKASGFKKYFRAKAIGEDLTHCMLQYNAALEHLQLLQGFRAMVTIDALRQLTTSQKRISVLVEEVDSIRTQLAEVSASFSLLPEELAEPAPVAEERLHRTQTLAELQAKVKEIQQNPKLVDALQVLGIDDEKSRAEFENLRQLLQNEKLREFNDEYLELVTEAGKLMYTTRDTEFRRYKLRQDIDLLDKGTPVMVKFFLGAATNARGDELRKFRIQVANLQWAASQGYSTSKILGFYRREHDFGIVMKDYEGFTLESRIKDAYKKPHKGMKRSEYLRIGYLLAQTVDVLHNAGLIIGDLSPRGIFMDFNLRPVIADFGLSRVAAMSFVSFSVATAEEKEVEPYLAPEVWKDHPTRAGDVWSLACIMLEMISGLQPHSQIADSKELLDWVGVKKNRPLVPSASQIGPATGIGPALHETLNACFEADIEKRLTLGGPDGLLRRLEVYFSAETSGKPEKL